MPATTEAAREKDLGSSAARIPTLQAALSVADILDRAADLIEPEGRWTQGRYGDCDDEGNYSCLCLFGAISQVTAFSSDDAKALRAVADLLQLNSPGAVIDWNDREGRTQAEVVAALRQAAEKARQAVSQ